MIKKISERTERFLTWINLITGSSVLSIVGWISHTLATKTAWIAQLGLYGIWAATLIGVLLFLLIIATLIKVRGWYIEEKMKSKWLENVEGINPLDTDFHKKRISVRDIVNPINRRVSKKKFNDCEFIGPANIFLNQGSFIKNDLFGCEFVVVREGFISNIFVFDDCQIINSKIYDCTIFIPQGMVEEFEKSNAKFITLTGYPHIDKLHK